jgi:hypothetical protein
MVTKFLINDQPASGWALLIGVFILLLHCSNAVSRGLDEYSGGLHGLRQGAPVFKAEFEVLAARRSA